MATTLLGLWLACAAQPAGAQSETAFTFPAGTNSVTVPVRVVNGQIVVRLLVNGRGLDVILDSGSSENVLDPSIFTALELGSKGQTGRPVPQATIGSAQIQGLQFVARPYFRRLDDTTTVVGILGYGFLRNAVVAVDYAQSTMQLFDSESFTAPSGDAHEVQLDLSDRAPLVRATVGAGSGDRFVVDTGATTIVVFSSFTDRFPDEFGLTHVLQDSDASHYYRRYFPVCGPAQHQPYGVSAIGIGDLAIRDWVVWKPDSASCLNDRAWDGLIGYDFLRLFTVYFDYPRTRLILQPNALYTSAAASQP